MNLSILSLNILSLPLPLFSLDTQNLPPPLPTGRHSREVTRERGQQLPTTLRRHGKAPPVEQFTGENLDGLLDDWLPTLERAGVWNTWSKEELLIQLAGHLRGRALQEWNLLTVEKKSNRDTAVKALRGCLEPRDRALAAQDFRHATQKNSETVADYIHGACISVSLRTRRHAPGD